MFLAVWPTGQTSHFLDEPEGSSRHISFILIHPPISFLVSPMVAVQGLYAILYALPVSHLQITSDK
jgi:hypothetical protein